jgi:hypothetical protein
MTLASEAAPRTSKHEVSWDRLELSHAAESVTAPVRVE